MHGFATVAAMGGTLRRASRSMPPVAILVPALLVGAAMLLPLVYLIVRGSGATEEAWSLLFRTQTLYTLGRTLLLMASVTVISGAIAVPMAWLTVRTDLPFRRAWAVVSVLPLVIPSFVGAFLYISVLGPRGLLQGAMQDVFGLERLPEIYGLPGADANAGTSQLPLHAADDPGIAIQHRPRDGRVSPRTGMRPDLATLWRVTLPQLRPSIASGGLLVALYTLSDFGAVSSDALTRPSPGSSISSTSRAYDRSVAAVLSLGLVAMAAVVLVLVHVSQGRERYYQSNAAAARVPRRFRLGRWKWPALSFCGGVALVSLGLPMAVLAYWLARGLGLGEPLQPLLEATRNSVVASGLAAVATAMFAIPVAVVIVRHRSRLSRVLETVSFTGYALPGVVIALALVYFGANYARPLYQTLWLLVFAYVVLFFPVALGAVSSRLQQISPRLEDAARGLGRRPWQVLRSVTLPLLSPGILMGAALAFLITIKELPATLILGPLGFGTLATAVWSASSEAFFARAAAPAMILVLISSIPMAFVLAATGRTRD